MLAFTAARLLTPKEAIDRPLLLVDEGKVVEVASLSSRNAPAGVSLRDLGPGTIAPGYIDIHIHGSAGYDVMDDSVEALPAIERMLAGHGVTSYFPTTVTAPMDTTLRALERLANAIEARQAPPDSPAPSATGRAAPLGIHLEGPFISHARRGVHPPECLLLPKLETFERFWQASRGRIRVMTIAPELEGASELIAEAAQRGVVASLGHSDGGFDAAERAIHAGARHATHTFNAMRSLDHREPGVLGAVLTDDRVSADMIADGIHLNPAIVKLVARAKGAERIVLITDATSAAGMPNGRYRLGSFMVDVKDGRCLFEGKLAGSVLTMDCAVRNLGRFAGFTELQAVAAATRNPARVAQLTHKGALAPGADADFIVLDTGDNVSRTFIGGVEAPA